MATTSRHVAVIGAGPSGLVTARELSRQGHAVVVYERESQIGGIWIYMPETETDLLGLDPGRTVVHSSLYQSLRTNFPRESMGFTDYPFAAVSDWSGDSRRCPGHEEVLAYLKGFAKEFGVQKLIRFEREVVKVRLLDPNDSNKWIVKSRRRKIDGIFPGGEEEEEVFDAVVVCTGHFTEPRIAEIPGAESWPGKQIHSHNYRTAETFKDQVVVVVGFAASSLDITMDVAQAAKEVHVAIRAYEKFKLLTKPYLSNMWHHPMIEHVHEDGSVTFADGTSVFADAILHCTGYKYHYPFLETNGIVTVDDNRLGPLYKHVFPPALAPSLSFMAVPYKVPAFPFCEIQSKWIAGVLSGRIGLPSEKEMMEDIEKFYADLEAAGIPKRHTHLHSEIHQPAYDWTARQCGLPGLVGWRKEMFDASLRRLLVRPDLMREEWEQESDMVAQAYEEFDRLRKNQMNGQS